VARDHKGAHEVARRPARRARPAVRPDGRDPQWWLVKSEPAKYSWDDLERDGGTYWDGVRNAQARNNLARMRRRDLVLYYHSNEGLEVVGVARVTREAYPDPTTDDPRWVVVDLEPVKRLKEPVGLPVIKTDRVLRTAPLVRQSRLSVMPFEKGQFERVLALGKTRLRA
jgi:predicted RNA-binding protein with PUA-like domain